MSLVLDDDEYLNCRQNAVKFILARILGGEIFVETKMANKKYTNSSTVKNAFCFVNSCFSRVHTMATVRRRGEGGIIIHNMLMNEKDAQSDRNKCGVADVERKDLLC